MMVKVEKVFNTTLGFIAILNFPEGNIPRVNMRLKKDNKEYLIKGVSFNKENEMDSTNNSYGCVLSFDNGKVEPGDTFEVE